MDNYFQKYLSDREWLVHEHSFDSAAQQKYESLFTLGNGYIGSRGIYEEKPYKSLPGTFFAGLFDEASAAVAEMINVPNFFRLFIFNGRVEKLNIHAMAHEKNMRILDLKKGLLFRHTLFKNPNNHLFNYESLRFISAYDLSIAVMQVVITPKDNASLFSIDHTIDSSAKNHRKIIEYNKSNFEISNAERLGDIFYLAVESLDHNKEMAFAQAISLTVDGNTSPIANNYFEVTLQKGQTAIITKIVAFDIAKNPKDRLALKGKVIATIQKALDKGFDQLLNEHIEEFEKKWQLYDIKLKGDHETQADLRLNLYHIMISGDERIQDASIGAKLLSGEGYRGHIFWDTEMLMLPCYLFAQPEFARQLLEYRYQRLASAKELAASRGFKGALFPWESAESGFDETPSWTQDLDKTIKIVHTGRQGLHINVAIFYAIHQYFFATKDVAFMLEKGLPMMIEMARFWKSRVVLNRKAGLYKIKYVIGPDEFHDGINNNAYTNKLVAWSFEKTLYLLDYLKKDHPEQIEALLTKMKFYEREREKIQRISKHMYIPRADKLIVQFDNFMRLKYSRLPAPDVFGLPSLPPEFLVIDFYKTQFVKQADVVLLLLLLPQYFDRKTAEANFHFYNDRTLHRSSWSPPIHAAVAAQLSFCSKACNYFHISLNTDKKDVFGNCDEGMHTPAVGGTWVAMVYGFCGIRILEDKLLITPNLPEHWQEIAITFRYLEFIVSVKITKKEIIINFHKADCAWLTGQTLRKPNTFIYVQTNKQAQQLMPNHEYVISYVPSSCFDALAT
jgi:kojibiose phosphorylase